MLNIIQMQYQRCYIVQEKCLYIFSTDKTFSLSSSGSVEPLDMEAMGAEEQMYTGLHSLTEAVI